MTTLGISGRSFSPQLQKKTSQESCCIDQLVKKKYYRHQQIYFSHLENKRKMGLLTSYILLLTILFKTHGTKLERYNMVVGSAAPTPAFFACVAAKRRDLKNIKETRPNAATGDVKFENVGILTIETFRVFLCHIFLNQKVTRILPLNDTTQVT